MAGEDEDPRSKRKRVVCVAILIIAVFIAALATTIAVVTAKHNPVSSGSHGEPSTTTAAPVTTHSTKHVTTHATTHTTKHVTVPTTTPPPCVSADAVIAPRSLIISQAVSRPTARPASDASAPYATWDTPRPWLGSAVRHWLDDARLTIRCSCCWSDHHHRQDDNQEGHHDGRNNNSCNNDDNWFACTQTWRQMNACPGLDPQCSVQLLCRLAAT